MRTSVRAKFAPGHRKATNEFFHRATRHQRVRGENNRCVAARETCNRHVQIGGCRFESSRQLLAITTQPFQISADAKILALHTDQYRAHLRVFVAFNGGFAEFGAESKVERIPALWLGQGEVGDAVAKLEVD